MNVNKFSSARMWGAADTPFQDRYNYLIDLLSTGISQEVEVGGERIQVTMSPKVGFQIKNLTTNTVIFGVDSVSGDGYFSGDVIVAGEKIKITISPEYGLLVKNTDTSEVLFEVDPSTGDATFAGTVTSGGDTIIGANGVLSIFQFESNGNVVWGNTAGWADMGHINIGGTLDTGKVMAYVNVPSNFTIEKVTIIIKAMPLLYYDGTYSWKQSKNLKLYQSSGIDGYAVYPDPGTGYANVYTATDRTSAVLGVSSWSPALQYTGTSGTNTANKIQTRTGDATGLVVPGTPTIFYVSTTQAPPPPPSSNMGLGKLFVIVEGYATKS